MKKYILNLKIIFVFLFLNSVFFIFSDKNFIFVEGEDAIVTNYNSEPTFNFKCSNIMALQLNRREEIEGSLKFFSEYIFEVEEDGEFVLWVAGTPPGPASPALPSYFSPYIIQIDENNPVSIYFEDVIVTEKYTSGFYWTKVSKIKLSKGRHKIRFQVKKRRDIDNYYYSYIDAFFFLRVNKYNEYVYPEKLPTFFPKNITSTKKIDFKTAEDYLSILKNDPINKDILESISDVYTLTYQYTDAIKHLRILLRLDTENIEYKRLIAQNYLWSGDFTTGINIFKEILKDNPTNISLYKEIGKIIAWSGIYKDSIDIYIDGLKKFKDDIELQINLALTYYWNSDAKKGESILESIKAKGIKNPKLLFDAAFVLKKNRYFDLASNFLQLAVNAKIDEPLAYTTLAQIYLDKGMNNEAEKVLSQMSEIFKVREDYEKEIALFRNRVQLKNELIKILEDKLTKNNDDIESRLILAQFYSWYHQDEKAIEQYQRILETKLFKKIETFENDNMSLNSIKAKINLYLNFITKEKDAFVKSIKELENSILDIKKNNEKEKNENLIKELEKKIVLIEKKYDIFEHFLKEFELINKDLNKIISEKKDYIDLFRKEITEFNWKFNYSDFKKEHFNLYKKHNSYLSLKILTTTSYYLLSPDFETFFSTIYSNYSTNDRVKYQYLLALLDKQKTNEAFSYIQENILSLAPINPEVQDIRDEINKIKSATEIKEQDLSVIPLSIEIFEDRLGFLVKNSESLVKQIEEKNQRLKKALLDINALYIVELNRYIFQFEKESTLLRSELANFFTKTRKYKDAENEFNRVLLVEPDNMNVKYMLANVYQLRQDWYKAMKLYREVFYNDPKNSIAASLYNNIIDSHPIIFSSKTKYTTEGSVLNNTSAKILDYAQSLSVITETINTNVYFNRILSMDFTLDYISRTRKNSIGYINYSYSDDIVFSFPMILRYNNFTLKTKLGVDVPYTGLKLDFTLGMDWINSITLSTSSSLKSSYFKSEEHEDNFIDRHIFYPYAGFNLTWKFIPYFNILFVYSYQLNKESLIPYTRGFYFHKSNYIKTSRNNANIFIVEHLFNLALNYNFAFANFYPFTNISFSTNGEVVLYTISDIMQTQNNLPFEYTISQNIDYKFLDLKSIGYSMNILFIFLYEGSIKDFDKNIKNVSEINSTDLTNPKDFFLTMYIPHQNIYIKGGINFEYNFETLTKLPLTIWTKTIFAPAWKHVFTPLNDELYHTDPRNYNRKTPFFYTNIIGGLELELKKFTLNFDIDYALTWDIELAGTKNAENFQSLNCNLYISVPFHKNITY